MPVSLHLRSLFGARLSLVVLLAGCNAAAQQPADALLDEVAAAYGGQQALARIDSFEYEAVGYFIGRYQSRYTEPPYDRLPVRAFAAIDLEHRRSTWDSISTWPGELNMGTRAVVDGDEQWTLNTISRIYTDGAMHGYDSMVSSAAARLPWLLVRRMLDNRDRVSSGEGKLVHGIHYDVLRYKDRLDVLVHPRTRLIYAIDATAHDMTDGEIMTRRVFSHYFDRDGVMLNRRYQVWRNDVATTDAQLVTFRTGIDIEPYLAVPDAFKRVPSMDGYNGQWEIGVEDLGDGIYIAGNGETRILYVEIDDYFVAIEAGGMPHYAEETYNAMRPYMNGKPLRYIVPTHHHDDHAIAVHFYARIGTTILTTRDKEGFLNRLLATSWDEHGPVENARFEFIEEMKHTLSGKDGTVDLLVYADAPHTENMIVAYVPGKKLLFTADIFIGWAGDEVRQGASYSARHLNKWVDQLQGNKTIGGVDLYVSVHGRAYTREEMNRMLATERTVVTLPANEAWPTASWPARYGLADDTVGTTRRSRSIASPGLK